MNTRASCIAHKDGSISAVILINGIMAGTWNHEIQRDKLSVQITLFDQQPASIKQQIEDEAHHIGAILGVNVVAV